MRLESYYVKVIIPLTCALAIYMSFSYVTVIGETTSIAELKLFGFLIVDYCQGFELVHFGALTPKGSDFVFGSSALHAHLAEQLRAASVKGGVAFVFAESFGGTFESEATAWKGGQLIYGPAIKALAPYEALSAIGIPKESRFHYRDILEHRASDS